MTFTLNTPWGKADHYENLGQGIMSVSTSSHGGIFVPDEMLGSIPEAAQADAERWSGSKQWYEEDCCWAHVAVAFPDRFEPENVDHAKRVNASRGF